VKLILRDHVTNLGERGEIVNVARGYARNYLVPKGLAFEATPGNIRTIELQKKVWEAREVKVVEEAQEFALSLLRKHDAALHEIARRLDEDEVIEGSEVASIVANTEVTPEPETASPATAPASTGAP